ncbi:hypothetical protein [Mesorhizobium sp.]|uniref:hypothetical protein n=1 Tax=Mesorhizobium sp. TaxID=1871066 RepID=UPI0012274E8D|nr:hypothetical protein [Mesorhizobium sp.]TIT00567.1 MAG: hypothetical protein E5W87_18900 [Mesorhizobium sp.]
MSQTSISLRNRLILLQEEYRDAIVGVSLFCAITLVIAIPIVTRHISPIVALQKVVGIVENVTTTPLNPKAIVGRGIRYLYQVRLRDSGMLVLVQGEVGSPHMIGSEVSIEQQQHQNGTDTYQLLNE